MGLMFKLEGYTAAVHMRGTAGQRVSRHLVGVVSGHISMGVFFSTVVSTGGKKKQKGPLAWHGSVPLPAPFSSASTGSLMAVSDSRAL